MLFNIDVANDRLVRQFPPNDGTLVNVGALGVDATSIGGFDIVSSRRADGSVVDTGYATLTVGGVTGLYTIDLATGAATFVNAVDAGATSLQGLTAGIAAPAYGGIPVTHRGVARGFTVVTGHDELPAVPPGTDHTVVLLMGVGRLARSAQSLVDAGRPVSCPVAVVERGFAPDQRVTFGTLADIAARAEELGTDLSEGAGVIMARAAPHAAQPGDWRARVLMLNLRAVRSGSSGALASAVDGEGQEVATLLPAADFSTRQPYADGRRLLDAGATVALATNCNPGSSNTTSMSFCIALAVREMHLTADEAVWAATAGGARALRRADVGRIAPGARADLVVLDAPSHLHLVYRPGVPLIHRVVEAGVLRYSVDQ